MRYRFVLVAMQWGAEIGLAPMQALQNIAVINGKPSVYGDAAMALVQASPHCEDIYEADGIIVKNINPIYYTKETQNWRIISDYLNDEQAELIRQLYSSPLVYLNIVNDNYITPSWIPVKPNATSYEVKKTASDKLFNLELDLEFQLLNTRQVI